MSQEFLPGIVVALIFSQFFSGIEVAFLAANKLQLELQEKQGILSGKIMSYFTHKLFWFVGTTRIGNVLSIAAFSLLMTFWLTPFFSQQLPGILNAKVVIIILVTLISTAIILILSELLAKSLFIANPNRMVSVLAIPFAVVYLLLFPVVYSIITVVKYFTLYIARVKYEEEKTAFRLTGLTHLAIQETTNPVKEEIEVDKRIFNNALEFKSVRIRECMIPRTEIVAVELEDGIEKLREAFVESGHSKILVYRNSIDDVIGYCHSSALFKRPSSIESILTPIITVPETTLANELMVQFTNGQKSLAVVVDEFGGTSGIVSMEDVIEEIFGEIEDEHDEDDLIEQKLDNQTYLLSARLEIDYLNDTYGWNLPIGDYETLGGLILSYTEDFPKPNESVSIPPFTFTIQTTEDNRIGTVKMAIANIEKTEE
ncbi:MAG: HlyC/CorC family transporter [Cyclobacteriaceae bacterium]|nr:HlyC/CorC family transporter [Cyclobacteriaceae bacterium]